MPKAGWWLRRLSAEPASLSPALAALVRSAGSCQRREPGNLFDCYKINSSVHRWEKRRSLFLFVFSANGMAVCQRAARTRPWLTLHRVCLFPDTPSFDASYRRAAFGYSESDLRLWLTLLLADRANMVEGLASDLRVAMCTTCLPKWAARPSSSTTGRQPSRRPRWCWPWSGWGCCSGASRKAARKTGVVDFPAGACMGASECCTRLVYRHMP